MNSPNDRIQQDIKHILVSRLEFRTAEHAPWASVGKVDST